MSANQFFVDEYTFEVDDEMESEFSGVRRPWFNAAGVARPAYVIGISGGSGSGKTSVSRSLVKAFNHPWVATVALDSFFKVLTEEEIEQAHNCTADLDHPRFIDYDLAAETLKKLKGGFKVEIPIYDFVRHVRKKETIPVYGADIIIFEGLYTNYNEKLRNLFDLKLFVQTDDDVRLLRRIQRDMKHRGRTLQSVLTQYSNSVKPNFEKYGSLARNYADMTINWNKADGTSIKMIASYIRQKIRTSGIRLKEEIHRCIESSDFRELPQVCRYTEEDERSLKSFELMVSQDGVLSDHDHQVISLMKELKCQLINYVQILKRNKDIVKPWGKNILEICFDVSNGVNDTSNSTKNDCNTGAIFITRNVYTREPEVYQVRIPQNIIDCTVILWGLCIKSGVSILMAIRILLENGAQPKNIIVVTTFAEDLGVCTILKHFPEIKIHFRTRLSGKLSTIIDKLQNLEPSLKDLIQPGAIYTS